MVATTAGDVVPRLGVSMCLLGKSVRVDGGHKRNPFLVSELGPWVQWVPVCPEMEIGLGTPRPSLRLVGSADAPRLVEPQTGTDRTEAMQRYAEARVAALQAERLDGFVVKKDSPTCGLHRVRVWNAAGQAERTGRGIFADRLARALPHLPIEEEGRLNDRPLRDNFLVRVFTHARLARLFEGAWSLADLVAFHTEHKMLLLASQPAAARELGRLVASARHMERETLAERYLAGVMEALARVPSVGALVNALQHMVGPLVRRIDADSGREMHDLIGAFGRGEVPLAVPLALLQHHARTTRSGYLQRQRFTAPCPHPLKRGAVL